MKNLVSDGQFTVDGTLSKAGGSHEFPAQGWKEPAFRRSRGLSMGSDKGSGPLESSGRVATRKHLTARGTERKAEKRTKRRAS
jgi:hypothetical protein